MTDTFDLTGTLRSILSKGNDKNVFDLLLTEMNAYFNRPVTNCKEMKERDNMKLRGDVWEHFCREWLLARGDYTYVWLWKDIPSEVREKCNLDFHRDNGIDLVAYNNNGYTAVQCKFRKKKGNLEWQHLSTFIGLCSITGPWCHHIIMTNCVSVNRPVQKGPKDKSICLQSFRSTAWDIWLKMSKNTGNFARPIVSGGIEILPEYAAPLILNPVNIQQVRELRLKRFEGK